MPLAPVLLNATPDRSGEVDLYWQDRSINETRFEVESRKNESSNWNSIATAPANTLHYRHTGLRAGDIWVYRVRACNDVACSAYSAELAATVRSPAAPSALIALANTSGRIDLVWSDNSNDESSFGLEYRQAPSSTWFSLVQTAPDVTTYAHVDLHAGNTYSYRIRACSAAGCSDYSTEAQATVIGPKAPTDLVAVPVGSGRIDLTWRDNSGDEASFFIEYRKSPDTSWFTLASPPPNTTTFAHTGLSAGSTYSYRVSACNASGCSQASAEAQATVASPKPPSNLAASPVGSGRIDLRWNDNSDDEARFWIEYRKAPDVSWFSLESTAPNATSFSHTGLRAGAIYTYRVQACNASGCSPASSEAQATVLGPAAPTNLSAVAVGSGRIDLSWQDNSTDEANVQVEARRSTSSLWSIEASLGPNTRTYSDTGLHAGDTYVYRVRVCNAAGCSDYSAEASATALGPASPSNLSATAGTAAISLSWRDNSSDEESFELQSHTAVSTSWSQLAQLSAGVVTYTHSGLTAGSIYSYRVRSCNSSGCSGFSNEAVDTVRETTGGTALTCPSGWSTEDTRRGVILCKRDGKDEYVVQVDLRRGARVHNVFELAPSSQGFPFPLFKRLPVTEWWDEYQPYRAGRFCMMNGTFFRDETLLYTPSELSFPLRDTARLITIGTDTDTKPKSVLFLNGSEAWIDNDYPDPFITQVSVVDQLLSRAEGAIVGWERYGGENLDKVEGQTFAAVKDTDGDGRGEILIFYVSTSASPNGMNQVLNSQFGVATSPNAAIRFDGGHSTQLRCANGLDMKNPLLVTGNLISRQVAHAFVVVEGTQ